MCRWFAYISPTEPCLLEDVLVTPNHSLIKQVSDHYLPKLFDHLPDNAKTEHEADTRNKLFNIDGFGLAYYTRAQSDFTPCNGLRPIVYKTVQPPLHDTNFRSLALNTSTNVLFAHIRAATDTPIVSVNNHPFVFGRHVIMHNGTISDFKLIARDLALGLDDEAYENVRGSTDSEHFAALYVTYLTNGNGSKAWQEKYSLKDMKTALERATRTTFELQRKKMGNKAPGNSLNVAVTDGESLIAIRVRNHVEEQPPSLYWSHTAGVTLNSKYPDHPNGGENPHTIREAKQHGLHVIVASEPSTYKEEEWTLIDKNHCLLVGEGGVRTEEFNIPADLISSVASV